MILKAGLTGGLASGKSTVARMFAELGCFVIDADRVVAQLYEPGRAGHEAIARRYGAEVLASDGTIDRQKLADIAFATPAATRELNALIHPLVIDEEARLMGEESARGADRDRIFIVEATLLLESGGRQRYDRIIVVDVDPATGVDRAVARGMSRDDAVRRIARQMPREERLRQADYVIDAGGTLDDTAREVRRVHASLLRDLDALR